jgi:hypothetical protein
MGDPLQLGYVSFWCLWKGSKLWSDGPQWPRYTHQLVMINTKPPHFWGHLLEKYPHFFSHSQQGVISPSIRSETSINQHQPMDCLPSGLEDWVELLVGGMV